MLSSIPGLRPFKARSASLLPSVTPSQRRCSGSQAETQLSELLIGLTLAYEQGKQESGKKRGPQGVPRPAHSRLGGGGQAFPVQPLSPAEPGGLCFLPQESKAEL